MKAVIVTALLLATTVAHADDKAAAERYFRAGARAYAAQSFEAAATDFDEAYKNYPLPEIAFSAAQAYRRLYRVSPKPEYVTRSIELYRAYLDKVKTGGRVGDAADSLAEMQHEADRLGLSNKPKQVEAVHTRIGVSVTFEGSEAPAAAALREIPDATGDAVPGLTATLDGNPLTPFALVDASEGSHTIAVTAYGFFPVERKVMAVAGQSQLVEIELKAKPARVTVATESGAEISVDGRPAASPLELQTGRHLLAIVHRGREPFTRELAVTRGQELKIDAPLVQTGRRRAVPWLASGTGVAAALAVTTGVLALGHDGNASDLRAQIGKGNADPALAARYDDEVTARDHDVTATLVLGGTAVALGAATLALYWFDKPEPRERAIVPVAVPGGAGVGLAGRY